MLVDINTALKLSGENRPELERVLSYYKDAQPDALKYQAAKYLICNKLIGAVRLLTYLINPCLLPLKADINYILNGCGRFNEP